MKVLLERGIPLTCLNLIHKELSSYGLNPSYYSCNINKPTDMNELSLWISSRFKDKVLLLTRSQIKSKSSDTAIEYKGIADNLDGNIAVVSYSTSGQLPSICLHELFHLAGITHCYNMECIMSLRLIDGELKYYLTDSKVSETIPICKRCDTLWKRKMKRLN